MDALLNVDSFHGISDILTHILSEIFLQTFLLIMNTYSLSNFFYKLKKNTNEGGNKVLKKHWKERGCVNDYSHCQVRENPRYLKFLMVLFNSHNTSRPRCKDALPR